MKYNNLIFMVLLGVVLAQPSGPQFRKNAVHNGNLVRTVFSNYGVIAQPGNKGPRGAWIHDNNGYIGDVSLIVGVEINSPDVETGEIKTFHSTVVCPVDRPVLGSMEQSQNGALWGFEPVSGYVNDYQESVAMSTNFNSWPLSWPDKSSDWNGEWNGFFGKDLQLIQQESYYVMDDNNDLEFNYPENNIWNVGFKPDSTNLSRNGLGLEVRVRGMQWQQFMAQDCLFWLYEITNTSTTDYSKVAFGELVGTYVGVSGSSNIGNEYDDDWSFFDVNEDMTFTGDYDNDCSRNPNWVGDVGMVGYAFLESPGNPYDGIDNDGDADILNGSLLFEEHDFDSILVMNGASLIVINDNYERSIVYIDDSMNVETRGGSIYVVPGETYLSEGNILIDENGYEIVNPNAFDGVDNDLDGLIDENYFVHYRQRRVDQDGTVLFDIINPRAYINYSESIENSNPLIDEKRDDGIDNDGDWDSEFHDVGEDGVMDTGDFGENDGIPTAGEPNFDETDPDESDQIGLTSFDYFTPANDFPHAKDEDLWYKLAPGFFDVPSSIENGEPIAGEDGDFIFGSGYFPLRAGQTERFSIALVYGEDKDDLLRNKQTVQNIYDQEYKFPPPPAKPTLTAVAGDGNVTLYWDRKAEEYMDPILHEFDFQGYKIYRATDPNFNDVRNITNALGVIEGYEPIAQFDKNDDIEGFFYPTEDLFQASQGFSFYLGENTGLVHKYVDDDVQNGRTYYYALVAYDHGNPVDLFPAENSKFITVLPNGEIITDINTAVVTPNAEVSGYGIVGFIENESYQISPMLTNDLSAENVEVDLQFNDIIESTFVSNINVDLFSSQGKIILPENSVPNVDTNNDGIFDSFEIIVSYSYYVPNTIEVETPELNGVGTGGLFYEIVDEESITGDSYKVEFWDTSNDEVDNNEDSLIDENDKYESNRTTTFYSVLNKKEIEVQIFFEDSIFIDLGYLNIHSESFLIEDIYGNVIENSNYFLDNERGKIIFTNSLLLETILIAKFNFYPIYKSPYIQNSPFIDEDFDTEVFDGIRLIFENDWDIQIQDSKIKWITSDENDTQINNSSLILQLDIVPAYFPDWNIFGIAFPNDYYIEFSDNLEYGVSLNGANTNFKVYDLNTFQEIQYYFSDGNSNGQIDNEDNLIFKEEFGDSGLTDTWLLEFKSNDIEETENLDIKFGNGDTLFLYSDKPFRKGDEFDFSTIKPSVISNLLTNQNMNVRVVPNPYISATRFEAPLPPGITSGRGERKIEFRDVPNNAEIKIFTTRGQHIRTLFHDGNIFDGTVAWDLKTYENLDVAFGVYFYTVKSSLGIDKGKIAIIK
ncbi:MAG: hypothetical protein CMF96_00820 [Candidatus Marinimicrobia bacterium]|nr:hypothetical protein [Candidatus Neomarinimicrobiota bacterium]